MFLRPFLRRHGAVASCAAVGGFAAAEAGIDDEREVVTNWSGTHSCAPLAIHSPETVGEVEALVAEYHFKRRRLRPCGSALSPNGLALTEGDGALLNLGLLDGVVRVDAERETVTVRCGARVDAVLDALAPHGLTLENLASIAQQQIGGFVSVGAHGTGASLPPVDEHVVALTVVTPGAGTLRIRRGEPEFDAFTVGLGLLGVLVEVELRCVPKHLLRERTFVLSRADAASSHARLLRENRHVRYMWIPHEDAVVVVTNNPTLPGVLGEGQGEPSKTSDAEKLRPLRELLADIAPSTPDPESLNFAQLRDALLAAAPLDAANVKRVNGAEAKFWENASGSSVGDSSTKLNFECGGQQWVNECCLPAGTLDEPSGADVAYVLAVLQLIENADLPAPAPIEQRWTSGSSAWLSPARGKGADLFSWVGIIMYLPTDDPEQRAAITAAFDEYKERCEVDLWPKFQCVEHWAKIEKPATEAGAKRARARVDGRYPTAAFAAARAVYDPHAILANDLLDAVLPRA